MNVSVFLSIISVICSWALIIKFLTLKIQKRAEVLNTSSHSSKYQLKLCLTDLYECDNAIEIMFKYFGGEGVVSRTELRKIWNSKEFQQLKTADSKMHFIKKKLLID